MNEFRQIIKRIVLVLAYIPVLPLIIITRLGDSFGNDDFFTACACFLALLPGKTGSFLRLAYYRCTLESVSPDVFIGFGSYFSRRGAVLGRNVSIGAYCILGDVTLEDRVLLASRVSITSGKRQHAQRYDIENPSEDMIFDRVTIGRESWIGEGAIIMADVGERSIVSAGSVVSREMPAGRIIAGNPARVLQEVQSQPSMKSI
ncbi:nodulation protein L [Geobacter sp. OR-1]|uniref:acyltransferase n=1 Tax=Geobacter sp. OR-1 TaxID=1266765 RepID=UPI000544250F|nr:acyltransferase [Geobacter sp. OR-1]GAM10588.1 nodulation protein L [Geobacter sp. OR-1]